LFNEKETLLENKDFIRRELVSLKIENVECYAKETLVVGGAISNEDVVKAESAQPGNPSYRII
jgi:hypothetical protein